MHYMYMDASNVYNMVIILSHIVSYIHFTYICLFMNVLIVLKNLHKMQPLCLQLLWFSVWVLYIWIRKVLTVQFHLNLTQSKVFKSIMFLSVVSGLLNFASPLEMVSFQAGVHGATPTTSQRQGAIRGPECHVRCPFWFQWNFFIQQDVAECSPARCSISWGQPILNRLKGKKEA